MSFELTDKSRASVLVAILGNSDVEFDKGSAPTVHWESGPRNARCNGKALLAALDAAQDPTSIYRAIKLPLLLPILGQLYESGQRPDTILLVATDQPLTVGREHGGGDTIQYGELIKRYIRDVEKFPEGAIEIVPFSGDPTDYGVTFVCLRRLFADLCKRYEPGASICHLAVTGGTPALASALLMEGVAAYGAEARVYYVPRGSEQPRPVPIVQDLRAQTLRGALHVTVEAHAYAAATALIAAEPGAFDTLLPADQPLAPLFKALLRHGNLRLNADLAGARHALALHATELRAMLPRLEKRILLTEPTSDRERDAQILRDIIASAEVMYELGHLFDFITRVATFVESASAYIARYYFGVEETRQEGGGAPTIAPWVEQDPALKKCLRTVRYEGAPTRITYVKVMSCLARKNEELRPVKQVICDQRLTDLHDLRNACVHRYSEITTEKLREKWGGDPSTIVAGLRNVARVAGIDDVDDSPFDALQEALRELLAQP